MTKLEKLNRHLKCLRKEFNAATGSGVRFAMSASIDETNQKIAIEKRSSRWVSKRVLMKAIRTVVNHFWEKESEDWQTQRSENDLALRQHIFNDLIILDAMLKQHARVARMKLKLRPTGDEFVVCPMPTGMTQKQTEKFYREEAKKRGFRVKKTVKKTVKGKKIILTLYR